jgi:hypothetical protein
VSPLKIKIPNKNMRKKPTNTSIIYSSEVATHHVTMHNTPIHNMSQELEIGTWRSEVATHLVTKHNTPIHNILSTAPQLSISQKAPGTLPEDGNVIPKHVGATIHN